MPRSKTDISLDAPEPLAARELDWANAPIHQEIKHDWKTPEILIEGALGCAKTTVCLDKELDAVLKYPGIPILGFRWTEDAVGTKLKPAFEELMAIRGMVANWEAKEKRFIFPNSSVVYMFGLKAVSQIEIFNKIRGLGVCRVFGDQVEEVERAVAGELRGRLRPNLTATVTGRRFPFQLTFVANSSDHDFWLSKEFPTDNHIVGRKVFSISIFDNPHAEQASIDSLIRQYPPDHPKHLTMVLGQRGPAVDGDPVFEGIYHKAIHHRPATISPSLPILESFEMGTHNPTWVVAQNLVAGGLAILGGVRGEGLVLEDFLSEVERYRRDWLPEHSHMRTCVSPMGEQSAMGTRYTMLTTLRKRLQVSPVSKDSGNSPAVRLTMIEQIASYLRKRNVKGEESFLVNNDPSRFVIVNQKEGVRESAFVHHAFEAGAVWDKHFVSVNNKDLRQMHDDDKFATAVRCIENIVLNFCTGALRTTPTPSAQTVHQLPSGPMAWGS